MAELAANSIYLTVNGTNLAARFTEVKFGASSNAVDISHGAATHVQRTTGLKDNTMDITVGYDSSTVNAYITSLKNGLVCTIDYGPEGNSSGKPRHTQSYHIDSVDGPSITVKKDYVVFAIKASGADAPTNDLMAGATF